MKKMIHWMGCVAIVLFLSPHTMSSASAKLPDEIQKKEREKHSGWIGILIQDVNEKIARTSKLDSEEGAYVKKVVRNSPADSAGIREGDVIVEYKGKKLFDSDELTQLVRRTMPGTKVDVVVVHEGQKKTLHVSVGRKKESSGRLFGSMPDIPDVHVFVGHRLLGLQLLTLNEQLGEYFGAPNKEGVLVEEVEHESTAEKAGFKAGDIIIRVGKKAVNEEEKIQRELRKYDEGDSVKFDVLRRGATKTLSVEIEEDQIAPQRIYFPKPHVRIFHTDPFDDADMNLEMDEFHSDFDDAPINLWKSMKHFDGMPEDISNSGERLELQRREPAAI